MENNLTALREKRGLTKVALAKAAGITRQEIYNIEQGRNRPTMETALKISRALGEPVEAIFNE